MTRRLLLVLALFVLALPAAASAASRPPETKAPPGNSGIDEYLETVPGAGGDQRPGEHGNPAGTSRGGHGASRPGARSAGDALPPVTRQALERLGRDGRRLVNVVDATAPAGVHAGPVVLAAHASSPGRDGRGSASPVRATLAVAAGQDGGGGLGLGLPLILGASVVAVVAFGAVRRRSSD